MLIIGWILLFFSGLALLVRFGNGWSKKEIFAFSFLLGVTVQTLFFIICSAFSFQINLIVLIGPNVIWLLVSAKKIIHYFKDNSISFIPSAFSLTKLNYPKILLWAIIVVFYYLIARKSWYMPTNEMDAITSFDKLGIAAALEGTLRTFLFQYKLQGEGGFYPPLFQSAIAYLYLFGALQAKVLTSFFYASLLIGFYSLLKKITTELGATFYKFLLAFTPELYIHAGYLLANMPMVAYIGLGTIASFIFFNTKEKKLQSLSVALLIGALLTRQDAIIFVLPIALLGFFYDKKDKRKAISISVILMLPFIFWVMYQFLFLQFNVLHRFSLSGLVDLNKWSNISAAFFSYFTGITIAEYPSGLEIYGLSFLLPLLLIALDFRHWKNYKISLAYWMLVLLLYTILYLLIDENAQNATIRQLLFISYKRGLLNFIPFLLFIAATTTVSNHIFAYIDSLQRRK